MAMNRTPPIISMAWSPSNVKLTMWRQLLFELTHFCCVVKTMNNSLYSLYVGVGSRAAGRSTILRLRSKARQSLDWTHTSSGGWCWECLCEDESPSPPYHKAKNEMCVCVCLSDWKSEDVYMWRVSAYVFTLGDDICVRDSPLFPVYGTIRWLKICSSPDCIGDGTRLSAVTRVGGSHTRRFSDTYKTHLTVRYSAQVSVMLNEPHTWKSP